MPGSALDRIPGGYELLATSVALRREARGLWIGSPLHHWLIAQRNNRGKAHRPMRRPFDQPRRYGTRFEISARSPHAASR
jgi:hypothetical protein